jgi:hypothetical protein
MLGFNWGAQPNQNAVQARSAPEPLPATNRPPNTTSLANFAWQYRFSLELHDLLCKAHITSPHLLCLITNTDLKEAGLNFAQLAEVRDAYGCGWKESVPGLRLKILKLDIHTTLLATKGIQHFHSDSTLTSYSFFFRSYCNAFGPTCSCHSHNL